MYRLRHVCEALKFACCEPSPGDYDSCSGDDGTVLTREDIRRPNKQKVDGAISTSQSATAKYDAGRRGGSETDIGIANHVPDHGTEYPLPHHDQRPPMDRDVSEDSTAREGGSSGRGWIPSPGTDVTSAASPATAKTGGDASERNVRRGKGHYYTYMISFGYHMQLNLFVRLRHDYAPQVPRPPHMVPAFPSFVAVHATQALACMPPTLQFVFHWLLFVPNHPSQHQYIFRFG